MIDYYATLTVKEDATQDQIRVAFRRMVKKFHPDLNESREAWAHQQMKRVLDAYEVLSDEAKRGAYDRKLKAQRNSRRDTYRDRLAAADDPASRAELILYDLLNGQGRRALAFYEKVSAEDACFNVAAHLSPRDWMDCLFLLGEQYEKRRAHRKALHLYETIYHSPLSRTHYRHFRHEVADRIHRLCCRELARSAGPAEAIPYYERALAMRLKNAQKAFLHKKIAECRYEIGDTQAALARMRQALRLKPDLKGCQKICRRLGIEPDGNGGGPIGPR